MDVRQTRQFPRITSKTASSLSYLYVHWSGRITPNEAVKETFLLNAHSASLVHRYDIAILNVKGLDRNICIRAILLNAASLSFSKSRFHHF